MAMSSYEVVQRAIEFRGADRLPVLFAALGLDDTHSLEWKHIGASGGRDV